MIISYLGGECVKVQFGDIVLAFNPPSREQSPLSPRQSLRRSAGRRGGASPSQESKLKAARFGADVVFVSLNHSDFNGVLTMSYGNRQPLIISGPGEYEIKEVAARGFATESTYGGTARINTVYTVVLEGMTLCFLGALSDADLPAALKEELDEIDILFVPIGGAGVLTAAAAYKLSVVLSPRLIIPMHWAGLGEGNALKQFLKEAGEEKSPPQEKVTLKKKDLEGKEGEIIVLKAGQ